MKTELKYVLFDYFFSFLAYVKFNSILFPYGYNLLKLQEIEVMILFLMIVCLKSNIPRLSQFSFYWNILFFFKKHSSSSATFSIGCNFKYEMSCYQFTFQTLLDSDKLKESWIWNKFYEKNNFLDIKIHFKYHFLNRVFN